MGSSDTAAGFVYSQCLMNAAGPLKSLEHSGPPSECYLISKKDASGPTQGKKKKSKPIEIL